MEEMQEETNQSPINLDNQEKNDNVIANFFKGEWKAFKEEAKTNLSDKEKKVSAIDLNCITKEWKYDAGNKEHWLNKKEKIKGQNCSPLFYTVLLGITTILIPNTFMWLDFWASYEYLYGTWYIKVDGKDQVEINSTYSTNDTKSLMNNTCRNTTTPGLVECFEQDIIWGWMTLAIDFIPGIFWSLGIFIQIAIYLRTKYPDIFDKTWMLFFFFIPLAAISMVTFPIQLIIVSIIACFNDQHHWMTLTTKIGIADGVFNAHAQFILQLFIFFVRADRHPSTFQYLCAFGSLILLVWTRVESLLMDRGGIYFSIGQKMWWFCRFGPMFLFNSAFKLGSMSLILAMLRYNAIWVYGTIVITWCLLQLLFNEQCLPRGGYFLFIGFGIHSVSVAHISEEIKMIDTKIHGRDNIMWVTKLTDMHLKANMWFQNLKWFFLNATIIITLTVLFLMKPESELPIFWPFISGTVSFKSNKVYRALYIIAPTILLAGVLSLLLLWFSDFQSTDREKIKKATRLKNRENISMDHTEDPDKEVLREYPGWFHDEANCPGCQQKAPAWHRFVTTGTITEGKVVGRLTKTMFPLMNLWQNTVDKNVV